jgi:methionine-rich copper-binding protein CopC
MSRPIRRGRLSAILLISVVFGLTVPAVVLAHAELVRAIPADGSTVTEPVTVISGRYSESLVGDSNLRVLADDGSVVATGTPDPNDRNRMIARPEPPLTFGHFTVKSTAFSADGHLERAEWAFTVAATATPTPTAQSSEPASSEPSDTPEPTASATASPTPASPAPGSSTGSGNDVILPIIAALAIITIGAGLLLSRGRRGPSA